MTHLTQLLKNRRAVRGLGVLAMLTGLLANQPVLTALFSADGLLDPRSVVIIWLFDAVMLAVGLTLALSGSPARLLDLLAGVVITAALIFAAEKVFYRLNHRPPPPDAPPGPAEHREGSYANGFFQPDDLLGYTVGPGQTYTSIKKLGDELVYDVSYTIDDHSRRVTPVDDPKGRDKFILFFGGSFVFGEGLNDDETLPAQTARLARGYRPYNYGLSGYGPQQMLAKLQSGTLPTEVSEPTGVAVYVFIDGHVERALGSMWVYNTWGAEMPYYALNADGDPVRRGSFRTGRPLVSSLYRLLGKSEIARYFNVNIPPNLRPAHYAFAARLVAAARDSFIEQYPAGRFYVLIYPDEGDYAEDIIPFFEADGLTVLNYDEAFKLSPEEGLGIAGDGHPTGLAHRRVAEYLVTDTGLNTE